MLPIPPCTSDITRMVHQSQEVLTRAVLVERAKGTNWETIAEQLDIRGQSDQARYREAEQTWEDALHDPFDRQGPGGRCRGLVLHEAVYAPIGAGRDLDEWAQQQGQGKHAVTGGLPTLPLLEEIGQVLDGLSYLGRDRHKASDPAVRLQLTERQAALLDRIASEENRPEAAVQSRGGPCPRRPGLLPVRVRRPGRSRVQDLLRQENRSGQTPHPSHPLPRQTPGRRPVRDAPRRHLLRTSASRGGHVTSGSANNTT